MQGTDEIYLTHWPLHKLEAQRHQVIIKVEIDRKVEYKQLREENLSSEFILRSKEFKISDWTTACENKSFNAYIYLLKQPKYVVWEYFEIIYLLY